MEGLIDGESFENFRNRLAENFKRESLSENVLEEIDKWHDRKHEETNKPGVTIEQRVIFQTELAEIYIATERPNLALDTLRDALDEAVQAGLIYLADKITDLINSLNG